MLSAFAWKEGTELCVPCTANILIDLKVLHDLSHASHLLAKALHISEDIVGLLGVNTRDAVSADG